MMEQRSAVLGMPARKDAARWRAVVARDARRDGSFVFAVLSTGVYCRPSCPARRPRPERVLFFALPEVAEQAGFRSCRRCRPRAAAFDPRVAWVRRICRTIEGRPEATLADLGAVAGVSPHHLQRTFKRLMGITPRQYKDARRLGALKAQLKGGRAVADATYEAGYGSSSRLYERAPSQLGMTPATYRRAGRGMNIEYTIVGSALGQVLVAATRRGVSAVYLGDDDRTLEAALYEEYGAADIRRDDGGLRRWVQAIVGHLEGRAPHPDLPLDVTATAFQWRVWQELRKIPAGQTRSYGEVARAIGRPSATRAVARACAQNRLSVVVPCHRVVGANGQLTGYRWGIERKAKLLARERASVGADGR